MFAARQGFFSSTTANISGGNATIVGANTVRTFTSNDTLTVTGRNIPMTYLVLGAGGSSNRSAGAGAGGQVTTGTFIASGSYPITIGQGNSGNGQSSLSSIAIANIGANGAGFTGGNSKFNSTIYTGGNGFGGVFPAGGGGAGSGENGFNASNVVYLGTNYGLGGNGGNGYLSNISGSNVYYGGGGGGISSPPPFGSYTYGNGGLGGGTNGTGGLIYSSNAANNTGGGSGGGVTEFNDTTYGGSGIIIVTYVTPT
jgi:hypothetical protein